MIVTLGETANFIIQYEDSFPDAHTRAKALKATCENDFQKLKQWFSVSDGFGPSNKVTLKIQHQPLDSLGVNYRYQSDGTTLVAMELFDRYPNKDLADDGVRCIFVAEIIEVLMDYRNSQGTVTWNPGGSDGEGLSRVAAAMFYKDAYYKIIVSKLNGPFINYWLGTNARTDWISQTENTDKNWESTGCSMWFIYYLYSQLHFDMNSIVTNAGATLGETYHALTGSNSGYQDFMQLLSTYFPIGSTPWQQSENPFPLLSANGRTVNLDFFEEELTTTNDVSGTANISAFPFQCEVKAYKWTLADVIAELDCVAKVKGFGQPIYDWRINGQMLGTNGYINITTMVQTDDPNNPYHPNTSSKPVWLSYSVLPDTSTYNGQSGELHIYTSDYAGHVSPNIEVDVHEAYASSDLTSHSAISTLDTQKLTYEDQYYKDRAACSKAFYEMIFSHKIIDPKYKYWWSIVFTLPDPPPNIVNGIRILVEIGTQIKAIATKEPKLARLITSIFARTLNVPERMLFKSE